MGLLVISGPPGAGKSTVAALVAARLEPSVLVGGDAFFGFLATGAIEPWLPASAAQNVVVTDAAAAATSRFVTAGYATVYDGVLGPWSIDRFVSAAGLAQLDYVILLPAESVCLERVRNRSGHGFSNEAATIKMHREFARASVAQRHVLDNGTLNPQQTAERILGGTWSYRPATSGEPCG